MQNDNLIKELVEKINIISRQSSLKETCELASKHIVELFNLDYAVISLFDFMKREIVSNAEYYYVRPDKDMGLQHPGNWVNDSKYLEVDKDIVVEVFRQKRIVKVIGRHVFDTYAEDLPFENAITFDSLNGKIFEEAGHEKLARIYLPIVHRKLKQGEKNIDFSLGVIEVGLKESEDGEFSTDDIVEAEKNFNSCFYSNHKEIKDLEHVLQLYTDNFAQSCYYFIVDEEANKLAQCFIKLRNEPLNNNSQNYRRYATNVVKELTKLLNIEWGVISFKTFENSYINYLDKATFFSDDKMVSYLIPEILRNRESLNVESMVEYVCNISKAPYFSDDINRPGERYLEAIKFPEAVFSEMVVPIFHEEELVGVVDLYSVKQGYFNTIIAEIVNQAMETFAYYYMAKNRQNAYNVLIRPTGAWYSTGEVYSQLIGLLAEYYNTGNISLWVRNQTSGEEVSFSLYGGTPATSDFHLNFPFKEGCVKKIQNTGDFPEVDVHTNFEKEGIFFNYCRESRFKFYLSVCIKFNRKPELFVNIFSRLDSLKDSEPGDIVQQEYLAQHYEFLTQIATKVSMTLQNVRITEALKNMSDPLTHDPSLDQSPVEIYRRIVKSAQRATGADIVCLFPFNKKQNEIKRKDVISSDDKDNVDEGKAFFANAIFKDVNSETGLYFFDSDEEAVEFIAPSVSPDEASNTNGTYRQINKIKSTCVVRMLFGNKPVGVIFFNYKTEQELKTNIPLQQIILFFSSFAANHIYLKEELDHIKKEVQGLNDLYAKVVPLATRSNFFILVEGMSHIIKNAYAGITDDFDFVIDFLQGKSKRMFDDRRQKIQRAIDLVEGVLTILKFRDEKSSKTYVDIPKIIQATIRFFKISRDSEIEYTFVADRNIPDLLCEEAEFAMIIYNLVYNSITAITKAERAKGRIHLEVSYADDKENCFIIIEDNGIGIKHEDDELIYSAEWSTKDKGTGLGLYYIKKTLESYGGTINHQSDSRNYTKFILMIPVYNKYVDK